MPSGSDSPIPRLPHGLISYGPNANCTLDVCPVEWSALSYQPSLAASGVFISLFGITMAIHIAQGIRWKTWGFMTCMVLGCLDEIIGYAGRIILQKNPFSFSGFLMDMICITTAPVFYCAAIYVTLSRTIRFLDPNISRFNPKLLYWVFIPSDVISLVLQAYGGAQSSVSSGANKTGVNVSLAGLSFQVFTLVVFFLISIEYMFRYLRLPGRPKTSSRFKVYVTFLSAAILLILGRCVYRIDELSDGYSGPLFHNEGLFYAFESAFIAVAIFCLNIGHPGIGMQRPSTMGDLAQGSEEPKRGEAGQYTGSSSTGDSSGER